MMSNKNASIRRKIFPIHLHTSLTKYVMHDLLNEVISCMVICFCSQSSGNKDINLSRCKFDSQQINFSLQDALRYGT